MAKAFVVGQPIGHSRSPMIHGHWLESFALPGVYERIEVRPEHLDGFLSGLAERGYAGGNVTLPHKEGAFRRAEVLTAHAERLGSVNTLWLDEAGRLCGDSTDGFGFAASLDADAPGWEDAVRTAVVLGAGGAARAIVAALLDHGVPQVVIANRTRAAAGAVARLDPARIAIHPFERVDGALPAADLLVNTTQLGMAGEPPLELDLARLPSHAIVADIVYVPLETPLLANARRRGLRTVDGLGMLLHQAVPGFERWFGRRPTVTAELRALIVADLERSR